MPSAVAEPLVRVRQTIRDAGFRVLADNFGQRDADLRPIALFKPDLVKLDHRLVSGYSRKARSTSHGQWRHCVVPVLVH